MTFRLGEAARIAGHRLHVHERLGSTNTEALAQARAGAVGPLWIAAHAQAAGRGRRGNAWASAPGNLTASVLWPVAGVEPERVAGLGFVAGVALADALDEACGTADDCPGGDAARRFGLKWPNDVLVGGRKLAGILLEAETLPGGRRAVVIGFGVNVAAVPEGFPDTAVSLAGLGHAADAGTLLSGLTNKLAAAVRIWDRGRGFPEIRERWLARASGLGSRIAVRSGVETLHGVFEEIDEGGRLVILAPDGARRTVTAGEVHFGTAATAA
ncbi:biotin--[acetyl-CoA-carboxylase] ligase [uncultured Methylobacterium sp.]|uniref:biotin--[acetyl-CoA-carboxylase] ligase n=1 Tax=uncultured Methylobacterium sp. TaxID=157278 RepID=UPI0035CBEEEC